jgi:Ca-activated chloride channel homolog
VAQAELLVDDALALDNRAYGVLSAKTQTWVLLVGDGNYFLEQLLTSLPGVRVNVAPEVAPDALPQLLEANHLLIFVGAAPPPLQRGNYLLINTVPPDDRFHVEGTVANPQVLDWDRQHPLLEFVNLTDLRIEEALGLHARGEVHSLVDGTGISLMSVLEQPSLRVVSLGFDLMRSDLSLRVAFPIFVNNLLRWINPDLGDDVTGQILAGTPYPIFFETPVSRLDVQDPQGAERTYEVQGNPWVFADANQVGVYIMRYGEDKRYLAVNLLDEDESDITPADALVSFEPTADAGAVQPDGVVETPLWPYFLLGAVALVFGEWYVWCRD